MASNRFTQELKDLQKDPRPSSRASVWKSETLTRHLKDLPKDHSPSCSVGVSNVSNCFPQELKDPPPASCVGVPKVFSHDGHLKNLQKDPPPSRRVGSKSASYRIRRELEDLQSLQKDPLQKDPLLSCFDVDLVDEDLFHWQATITGPSESPYSGLKFVVDIRFPLDYPFHPPKIAFRTKIVHPNVYRDGSVYLPPLYEDWHVLQTMVKVLPSIYSMLTNPNLVDAVCPQYADMYRSDKSAYEEFVRQQTASLV